MKSKAVIFRFNLVEVALALVILAIGLSSVLVLFPIGLKASRSSVAENNMADIAERVAAYVQAKYTSPEMWGADGTFSNGVGIDNFDADPNYHTSIPTSDQFNDASVADGMDGLLEKKVNNRTYYLYRQYSDASGSGGDRAVDFEAMIRVGWDSDTLLQQYYSQLGTGSFAPLSGYSRTPASGVTIDSEWQNRMGSSASGLLGKCCRTLIIEVSWPADVEWAKREKRIFRVEIFNENFVPYPQTP